MPKPMAPRPTNPMAGLDIFFSFLLFFFTRLLCIWDEEDEYYDEFIEDHGCWPQRRPSGMSEMVRLYRSISGVCLYWIIGIHGFTVDLDKNGSERSSAYGNGINTLPGSCFALFSSSTLYTLPDIIPSWATCRFYIFHHAILLFAFEVGRNEYIQHIVFLWIILLVVSISVRFLYTKLTNVHRIFSHRFSGRRNHSSSWTSHQSWMKNLVTLSTMKCW